MDLTRATDPLIRVEDLHISFASPGAPAGERTEVVTGISFEVYPGETVGIVGESGSGKSVTVRSLLGLSARTQETHAREFSIFGSEASSYTEKQWSRVRGSSIGFVLQDALSSLDPLKTIGQEVAEGLHPQRRAGKGAYSPEVYSLLESAGIPHPQARARQYAHELSGGLRQRALIANAVAQNPALIIADEPTTALDVTIQAQVLELLRAKAREGNALILVSHDLAVVASVCDRILVMKDGEIVEQGPSDRILRHPRELYTRLLLAAVPSSASRGYRLSRVDRVPLPARAGADSPVVMEARGVSKTFVSRHGERITAVHNASLEVREGHTLGIVGESGSGKSTLARIVAGLCEPDQGSVSLDGDAWSPLPEKDRRTRRRDIQVVAQNPLASFDPRYTVGRIIAEPLRHLTNGSSHEIETRISEVLELVQLPRASASRMPQSLSGGQRQRVAIARAIATHPRILVADEAVSALDVSIQAQILDLLADIQAETGVAILFISHDLGVIHHVSDAVIVMKDGEIVESGSPDAVLGTPHHPYTRHLIQSLPTLPVPTRTPHKDIS